MSAEAPEAEAAHAFAAFVASCEPRVRANAAAFAHLTARAEACVARGALDEAGAWAQAAADFGCHDHPGLFASARLEDVLARIARAAFSSSEDARPASRGDASPARRRVLHVLSQSHAIGGHTRLLERWIRLDAGSAHDVAVTEQIPRRFSAEVLSACEASGGRVRFVKEEVGERVVAGARRLRSLAREADFVVSHAHPSDVVPAIAVSGRAGGAPAVHLNHADHVFWAGAQAFDLVACLRRSGAALCRERRGVPPERQATLPIPLDAPPAGGRDEAARAALLAELGLAPGTTVALSIARSYKFEPTAGIDLRSAVVPVIAERPGAALVVVGPEPTDAWRDASARAGGRILALGPRRDIARFYAAADVYVDSAPFASLTSLLEAGLHGAPVLSFQPHARAAILCTDDPGLDEAHLRPETLEGFRRELGRLLDEPPRRASLGAQVRAAIEAAHGPAAFARSVEAVYERARASASARSDAPAAPEAPPACDLADALLYELHRLSGTAEPVAKIVRRASKRMPLWPRLRVKAQVLLGGLGLPRV